MDVIKRIRLIAFDFDGVFTDNMVYVFEDGREAVRCCRSDGIGLRALERAGITPVIISTESNPVVTARANKLRVRCIQDCTDKLEVLSTLTSELNIPLSNVAYVGNDINDASCLEAVGLPIVVRDAHAQVLPLAQYRTHALGGHGAVREVCDLLTSVLETMSDGNDIQ